MNNEAKYLDVFMKLFEIGEEEAKALKYQDIPAWDSIGHMSLINELEETFNISMDADDIIDCRYPIVGGVVGVHVMEMVSEG